jgi:TusA-related sulfurtransferase
MNMPDTEIRTLELKGLDCPHTFVRAKLVMETLDEGHQLRVIVDNPLSKVDLPRSAEQHGYRVINIEEISKGVWAITLQK